MPAFSEGYKISLDTKSFSFSFTHFILKTPDYGTPPSAYTPENGFVTRRSVPAGGIGCEPACVRAPLKPDSHPKLAARRPPEWATFHAVGTLPR